MNTPAMGARGFATLQALLAEAPCQLRIHGTCMNPTIRHHQTVTVARARCYWPGDVLVVRAHDGRLYAHRLILVYRRHGRWRYVTRADTAARADTALERERILGRLMEPVGWRGRLLGWWGVGGLLGNYLHRKIRSRNTQIQ